MTSHSTEQTPLTILLVEDNPAHAELVRRSLQQHEMAYHLIHVSDGEEALNYLFRRGMYGDPRISPRPHVILLDLRLPKIDGLEVAREVKSSANLHDIPIVMLTSSKAVQDVSEAYAANINSYLVKPVDYRQFVQLMHDFGYYWLYWNYLQTLAD